jgi:beta-glucanase (GH16 family)
MSRSTISKKFSSRFLPLTLTILLTSSTIAWSVEEENPLLWSQEFNEKSGSKPDPKYWNYDLGDGRGWGNREVQLYTNVNAKTTGRGVLAITALQISPKKKQICYYGYCEWSSARITTKNKVWIKYGTIEARIQMPSGTGSWPAFWMLGQNIDAVSWPNSGEIDITEGLGRTPYLNYGTIHGPGYFGGSSIGVRYLNPTKLSAGFNTYGINWSEDFIEWTLNGKIIFTQSKDSIAPRAWVFNQPFSLILNVAMGGEFGGEIGKDAKSGLQMKVDWIRVKQFNGQGEVQVLP